MKMHNKEQGYPYRLIGEEIEIVDANNRNYVGIKGKVIDETKETLKVNQQGKVKTLLKGKIKLKLVKSGKFITGEQIQKRPEERIKG